MSNYNSLKATINANVKTNGNQEITGSIMNSVLNAMVTTLGAGYQYMGVAIPSTNPGTPDAKVCYVAATPGTYTNFKNSSNVALQVADGEVAILKYDTAWSKEVTGAATAAQLTQLGQSKIGNATPSANIEVQVSGEDVSLEVTDGEIDLDSIIYEGKSLRAIFETYNILGISPGFDDGSFSPMTVNAGTPTVSTDDYDTPEYSLKCFGSGSSQILTNYQLKNIRVFCASRVKCNRYSAGKIGIILSSIDVGLDRTTSGWETVSAIKLPAINAFPIVGSFSSANLDGFVDSPVVVRMDVFTAEPTVDRMTEWYEMYITLKKGGTIPGGSTRTIQLQTIEQVTPPTAAECKAAFLAAMNAKASYIGATTAVFQDASGLVYSGAEASAKDILQILVHAAGIREIAEKWNKDEYTMTIYGDDERSESIETSVQSTYYDETQHPILGGKTGTIGVSGYVNYNLAWIAHIAGIECACVLMGDNNDTKRWQDAEAIADYLGTILSGGSATLSVNAPCVVACKLPANPIMYDNFSFDLLISKAPTTLRTPASLTKLMTLITAYDYITDENELVEIVSSDIIGGSGDNIMAGDNVTIRDLVYDMLLPSSNDSAVALARHIGKKILGY